MNQYAVPVKDIYVYPFKTKNPQPPETPPTLREAVWMVASLGGFLGRKSDGEPGIKSLWLGLQRLDDLTAMWKIVTARPSPPNPERAVSSEIFMDDGWVTEALPQSSKKSLTLIFFFRKYFYLSINK